MQKIVHYCITKLLGLYINILAFIAPAKGIRLAYKYFSEPRYGRLVKADLPEVLKEPQAETIVHDGAAFEAYVWPGNHIKVLLVHGWESNSSRWKLLISYLKKAGCTIIAVDAPAHGLSAGKEFTIPRYAAFVNVLAQRYKPQYLVGHSLGGATALYFQSHYPNPFIQKMVILGAPSDFATIFSNYTKLLSLGKRITGLLKTFLQDYYKTDLAEFTGARFASQITVPGLVVHDMYDETVDFKEGEKIAKAWPGAKFIATRGMGHRLHDDKLYQKIYAFLFKEKGVVENEEVA